MFKSFSFGKIAKSYMIPSEDRNCYYLLHTTCAANLAQSVLRVKRFDRFVGNTKSTEELASQGYQVTEFVAKSR